MTLFRKKPIGGRRYYLCVVQKRERGYQGEFAYLNLHRKSPNLLPGMDEGRSVLRLFSFGHDGGDEDYGEHDMYTDRDWSITVSLERKEGVYQDDALPPKGKLVWVWDPYRTEQGKWRAMGACLHRQGETDEPTAFLELKSMMG